MIATTVATGEIMIVATAVIEMTEMIVEIAAVDVIATAVVSEIAEIAQSAGSAVNVKFRSQKMMFFFQ